MEALTILVLIIFVACCIGAAVNWGYSAYYMIKTLANYHPERQWGKFIAFSLFMPYFFTEEGNVYRKLLLKHMGYFILLCLIGIAIGFTQKEAFNKQSQITSNSALKPTHLRGACFVLASTKPNTATVVGLV